jgi:arylsulfatase A-like enzyme
MSEQRRLTRRALLRSGGGAAGLAALGALPNLSGSAAAASMEGSAHDRPNVVLIVADRLRADAVKAYDDVFDNSAHTPSLDHFADQSLRFKYAVPESMPAIPVRRGILTGMRSYPFRDWVATPGVPAIPGWHKIFDFQPLIPELTAADGVETVYVTDNPLLSGPRFHFVRRTGALPTSANHTSVERSYFLPLRDAPARHEPTTRVLDAGRGLLDELKGKQPFFLGLDAFDPGDAFELPRQYVQGVGPVTDDVTLPQDYTYQQRMQVPKGDGLADTVRERYASEVTAVDRAIGRFLDQLDKAGLADDTVVIVVGDSGIALGEQGVFGHPAGVWHRRVYQVPLMIRDPRRRWAGETSSWFVSTHDIPATILSYLGITAPGKVAGEDLTTLFDDDDLPGRRFFTSAIDSHVVVGDKEWLLLGRTDEDHWRLYHLDDTDKPDDIEDKTVDAPTILEELKRHALSAGGGTLPRFGASAAIRPLKPLENDNVIADDGTLNKDERDANRLGGP